PVTREIVGVVGDVRERGPASDPQPGVYVASAQLWTWLPAMYVVVRTTRSPVDVGPSVRREAAQLDPDQPLANMQPMQAIVDRGLAVPWLRAVIIGTFAILGALLSWVGVYSLVSYIALERTREFGIRAALGASP